MDYRIYRAFNDFTVHHSWLGHLFYWIENYGTIALAAATVALWLLARPGGSRRWKLVSGSALAAAGVGLLVNQIISHIWTRTRPCITHHTHTWVACKTDASFPSDHASAAFAIAWTVFFFDRLVGSIFLAVAVLIGFGRIIVGVHYPSDVGAGFLVGLGSAVLVFRLATPLIDRLARLVERVTDPLLGPLWRAARR